MAQEPLIVTSFDRLSFLVIDDDHTILQVIEAFLKDAMAASVILATDCLAALSHLADKSKMIGCVVCDHSMPEMTGLALLQEIRGGKHPNIPRSVPFIMLAMSGQEAVVRAAIALDAHVYIRKPVTKDALTKAIHRAFNRSLVLKQLEEYLALQLPPDP